jgi:hypothetical protein
LTSELVAFTYIADCFDAFQQAYENQNYGLAADAFIHALQADPGIAFRYFVTRASGPVASALGATQKTDQMVAWLDELITKFPNINLLIDYDPGLTEHCVQLRQSNLDKGLPSIVLLSPGKTASMPVAQIFNSGFDLPSFCYSFVNEQVIESWARDYARGGACHHTHLEPRHLNVARLKRAGIDKIIVHVRDQRQSLCSMIHHVTRYPEQLILHDFHNHSVVEQVDALMPFYLTRLNWIQAWMNAASELNIMFPTFEEFVRDREKFIEAYLEFYGAPRHHFSYENATRLNAGTDYHFRLGLIDEWRNVFPPDLAKHLNEFFPARLRERFGWLE